jgi:hypothetical protein
VRQPVYPGLDVVSHRRVLGLGALALLSVLSCNVTSARAPRQPDPTAISLQPGDLPAFQRCPASGDIGRYVQFLQGTSTAARDELASGWRALQLNGASRAAVTVLAQQQAACGARLGTGAGPSVTTVVVSFRDEGAATAAYEHGMWGFATPSVDAEVAGMARGPATGIGRNAWVLERSVNGRSLLIGLWQRHLIAVLFVAVDSDPLQTKQAIATVDGRIP